MFTNKNIKPRKHITSGVKQTDTSNHCHSSAVFPTTPQSVPLETPKSTGSYFFYFHPYCYPLINYQSTLFQSQLFSNPDDCLPISLSVIPIRLTDISTISNLLRIRSRKETYCCSLRIDSRYQTGKIQETMFRRVISAKQQTAIS